MRYNAVFFDLGGTLAAYYTKGQFAGILEQAIAEVSDYLHQKGITLQHEELWERVQAENHESDDCRVRDLEGRLARIFGLDNRNTDLLSGMCRCFLKPTFALGYLYDDTLSVLGEVRSMGLRTAIVSNSPCGSPSDLWREEIARLGLTKQVDEIILCRDCGWRKPARQIFDHALEKMGSTPETSIFVGDHPRWDIAGPRAIGMDAILIDREGFYPDHDGPSICNLHQLLDILRQSE